MNRSLPGRIWAYHGLMALQQWRIALYGSPSEAGSGWIPALGDFLIARADNSSSTLVDLWNREMTMGVDEITCEQPLTSRRIKPTPWFSEELLTMKLWGRHLE